MKRLVEYIWKIYGIGCLKKNYGRWNLTKCYVAFNHNVGFWVRTFLRLSLCTMFSYVNVNISAKPRLLSCRRKRKHGRLCSTRHVGSTCQTWLVRPFDLCPPPTNAEFREQNTRAACFYLLYSFNWFIAAVNPPIF